MIAKRIRELECLQQRARRNLRAFSKGMRCFRRAGNGGRIDVTDKHRSFELALLKSVNAELNVLTR